ncbi:MAG TPA: FIST C-terminal domain-containing protein, partial [Acidimicrobiales bacterium]
QSTLSAEEVALINQGGLHLGLVIDEHKVEFGPGDFLVRNVMGADQDNGALQIGAEVDVGATVQFHLRDAAAADADLHAVLDGATADAALLFTCNGRGRRLFGRPGHDAGALAEAVGPVPTAGLFCAGEFGPVSGRNFLHGFTASIALFSRR